MKFSKSKSGFVCSKCITNYPFSVLLNEELLLTNFGLNHDFSCNVEISPNETQKTFFNDCNNVNVDVHEFKNVKLHGGTGIFVSKNYNYIKCDEIDYCSSRST